MTSQLPCFWWVFLLLAAEKKPTKTKVAVMSLRSFLFRDNFSIVSYGWTVKRLQ